MVLACKKKFNNLIVIEGFHQASVTKPTFSFHISWIELNNILNNIPRKSLCVTQMCKYVSVYINILNDRFHLFTFFYFIMGPFFLEQQKVTPVLVEFVFLW